MYERILVESTLTPSENKGMRRTSDDPIGRVFRSAGNRVMVVGSGEC